MKLQIQQTLGIVNAEIDLEPGRIVEVVGPNASGKTSLAVCAQAVLARDSNPLGLSAAESKRNYPHDGAEDAVVSLYDGANAATDWHANRGTIVGVGDTTLCHPSAVGLIDFCGKMKAKERAEVFQSALLPDPETVLKAVHERLAEYLPADDLAGAMEMLGERGWDATETVYGDRGREAKRAWNGITGKTWGIKVAADWRPDGWLADFDHLTPQIAEERVTNARDALNALHRVQAISESEQEAAAQAAMDLPILEQSLANMTARRDRVLSERDAIPLLAVVLQIKDLETKIDETRRNLAAHRTCPHCYGALAITNGAITVPEDMDVLEKRIEGWLTERGAAEDQQTVFRLQIDPLTDTLRDVEKDIKDQESRVSICRRESKATGAVQTEADRAALAQAEQAVEDTREVVKLVQAEADATRLHQTIIRYTEIARALGPEGVRSKMLADGMRKLNGGLVVIASASGWPLTTVGEGTCAVFVGDRPVALCSESEKWRSQASIQMTLGAITGSKAIVLDRGDILDSGNRTGLVAAVKRVSEKTQMAVLICSTGTPQADAPWQQVSIDQGVVTA